MNQKKDKKRSCQIFGWMLAIFVSFFLVNGLIFIYYNRPAWISREDGATIGVYHPEKTIYYAYEGWGINTTDENGYVNPRKPIDEKYILTLGASHTQGKEVMMEDKYTSLLDSKIGDTEKLSVYNMAVDGNYYPEIVKRFGAALEEFPDSEAIIIEIGDTDFLFEELQNSLKQTVHTENVSGKSLMESLSLTDTIKMHLKESMPLSILLVYKQFTGLDLGMEGAFIYEEMKEQTCSPGAYTKQEDYQILDMTMKLLKKAYSNPIIIMYHPEVRLHKDGSMEILRGTGAVEFEQLCKENGIFYVDMGDDFLTAYEDADVLPYGFMNGAPGTGHLNKMGHEMIAERLYRELEKIGVLDAWKGGNET